ncbi:hypothetical protein FE410_05295 [Leuconostoc carnosum]|uniref:phage tail terminator family protein n=1 Tax=Leuconostoc TaxID=1243 RepID=UPI0012383F42|nr:hypothetical protein [Leuconostoc carnosum]KAA8371106.1 hypothetical protein FE414_05290 [Leuconostoc carnosum]KAA8382747.1 hypothetical protein FE410_05295 [Leuconostoc carnosum]
MTDITLLIGNTLASIDPKTTIYRDKQNDGAYQTPCYLIQKLPVAIGSTIGHREHRTYTFDLVYMPAEDSRKKLSDIDQKSELLMDEFKVIQPRFARLWHRTLTTVGDVLHFQFDIYVQPETMDDSLKMNGNLKYKGGLLNGDR